MTQAKKATTLMEKFGFMDPDLTTPKHDATMVWLDKNIENLLLSRYPAAWNPDDISRVLQEMTSRVAESKKATSAQILAISESSTESSPFESNRLDFFRSISGRIKEENLKKLSFLDSWVPGEPPCRTARIIKKEWEKPVSTRTGYTVGFLDMKVTVGFTVLGYRHNHESNLPEWFCDERQCEYFLEVKPSIQSVGEVVRQVRLYQEHIQGGKWLIVSPDDKFSETFKEQGIDFIKVPVSDDVFRQNNTPPADLLVFIQQVFEKMEARGQSVNPEWLSWIQRTRSV